MSKNIFLIGGTMGVGKTTVCQELKKKIDNAVFLDGDWCWDADPFVVNEETKEMVLSNIVFLLNQFLHCSCYQNVIFCWVMNEQSLIDFLVSQLDLSECQLRTISLICNRDVLIKRIEKDVANGKRKADVLKRSLSRLPLYDRLQTEKIDTSFLTVEEVCERIMGETE